MMNADGTTRAGEGCHDPCGASADCSSRDGKKNTSNFRLFILYQTGGSMIMITWCVGSP